MDLSEIRREIKKLIPNYEHDDGSYAPLLIRFAWHNCGTYDKNKRNGGSNGSTMRFKLEENDPENAGLLKAKRLLEPIKKKYPELSYADLWTLAGTVAIEATGGPKIQFKTGRVDFTPEKAEEIYGRGGCPFGDGKFNPHKSRLPAADLGVDDQAKDSDPIHIREAPTINAVRNTFSRMGFNDKETVCLIVLGHQFGRCHSEVSGFENAWYSFDPTHWNIYTQGLGYLSIYSMAIDQYKEVKTSKGKRQFEMNFGGRVWMMLISDMVLVWDQSYKKYIHYYDRNRRAFKEDAIIAWTKLTELGCNDVTLTPELILGKDKRVLG